VVGSPSPCRARWSPSRHGRCSCEHERELRRISQRRWRMRQRDLSHSLGDLGTRCGRQRRRRGEQCAAADGVDPAPERRPPGGGGHAPRADRVTNHRRALPGQREQRQGERDGRPRVMAARLDLLRDDRDHRGAAHAQVPAHPHDRGHRQCIERGGTSNLPLTQAVPDEAERPPRLACSPTTNWATAGPNLVDRRGRLQPELAR